MRSKILSLTIGGNLGPEDIIEIRIASGAVVNLIRDEPDERQSRTHRNTVAGFMVKLTEALNAAGLKIVAGPSEKRKYVYVQDMNVPDHARGLKLGRITVSSLTVQWTSIESWAMMPAESMVPMSVESIVERFLKIRDALHERKGIVKTTPAEIEIP